MLGQQWWCLPGDTAGSAIPPFAAKLRVPSKLDETMSIDLQTLQLALLGVGRGVAGGPHWARALQMVSARHGRPGAADGKLTVHWC